MMKRMFLLLPILLLLIAQISLAQGMETEASKDLYRGTLFKIGKSVTVLPDEQVENVISLGGEVTIEGEVIESVISLGGAVIIRGKVGGGVYVMGANLKIESTAEIGSDAVRIGGAAQVDPGATIGGELRGEDFLDELGVGWVRTFSITSRFLTGRSWYGFISNLVAFIVIGLILVHFLPIQVENQSDVIIKSTLQTLGWGLLSLIVLLPLCGLLAVTIIGIPMIPVLILAYIFAGFFGFIAISQLFGRYLAESLKLGSPELMGSMVIGVLAISLIRLIPYIGELLTFIIAITGFGAAVITRFGAKAIDSSDISLSSD